MRSIRGMASWGLALMAAGWMAAGCTASGRDARLKPTPCRPVPSYLDASSSLRVVGVFTTWSLSAQAQWQRMVKLAAVEDPQKVRFFAVFTDPDRRMVDEWVAMEKPPFTVIHDPHIALCGRPAREVPTTYFLDRRGRLCLAYSGHVTTSRLSEQIRRALRSCTAIP